MPRQKSELTAGVDIYKLLLEKKRLQQELEMMEQRRQQITHRLAVIENQLVSQTNSIQQQQENPPAPRNVPVPAPSPQPANLQCFLLEYRAGIAVGSKVPTARMQQTWVKEENKLNPPVRTWCVWRDPLPLT